MKISRVVAIQDLAYVLGNYGCYYTAICVIAERITGKDIDLLKSARRMIDNNFIDYDDKRPKAYPNGFYIKDADAILKALGCVGYHIEKVDVLPKDYNGEYIIRYSLNGNTHFVVGGKNPYNSITYSNCVANGKITKYYLVKKN